MGEKALALLENSSFIGIDKRNERQAVYGLRKHYLERLDGEGGVVHPPCTGQSWASWEGLGNAYSLRFYQGDIIPGSADNQGAGLLDIRGSTLDATFDLIGTGDFSMGCWVNVVRERGQSGGDPVPTGRGHNPANGIVMKVGTTSGPYLREVFQLFFSAAPAIGGEDKFGLQANTYGGGLADFLHAPTGIHETINFGQWYHLLATRSQTTGKLYANGVLVDSGVAANFACDFGHGGSQNNITIGGQYYNHDNKWNPGNSLNGYIDEAAIWNAELSAEDVSAIYNNAIPNNLNSATSYDTDRTENLLGWWRMGDGWEYGLSGPNGTMVYDMVELHPSGTNASFQTGTLGNDYLPVFETSAPPCAGRSSVPPACSNDYSLKTIASWGTGYPWTALNPTLYTNQGGGLVDIRGKWMDPRVPEEYLPSFMNIGSGAFSMACWAYIENTGLNGGLMYMKHTQSLAGATPYDVTYEKFALEYRAFEAGGDNLPKFQLEGHTRGAAGNSPDTYRMTGTHLVEEDRWYHVAVTRNTGMVSGGQSWYTTTLYIDGAEEISETKTAFAADFGRLSPYVRHQTMSLCGEYYVVGNLTQSGSYVINSLGGWLDEAALWNKELSATEIAGIYNNGTPNDLNKQGPTENLVGWWRMGDGSENGGNGPSGAIIYDMSLYGKIDYPAPSGTNGSGIFMTGTPGSSITSPSGAAYSTEVPT